MCLEVKIGTQLEFSEEAWVLETVEARYLVNLENSLMCTGVTSRISIKYFTQALDMSQRQDEMPLSESNGSC